MQSQTQKSLTALLAISTLLSLLSPAAQADQRRPQQGGQYQGQYDDQGQYDGQDQYGDQGQYDDQGQFQDDQGYYGPQDGGQQPPQQMPPQRQGPPPQQEVELPPNYRQPNYQPPFRNPGFQYRNYQVPMESTLYCYRPNCVRQAPPVLPYPGPQVRIMPFPYRVQAQAFCQIRPLPGGLADIVYNGSVLLYRGYGPNVQAAIWHYRNTGICRNFF